MAINVELIDRLIKHYEEHPPQDWGWTQCVAGTLVRWGLVRTPEGDIMSNFYLRTEGLFKAANVVGELLGLEDENAYEMVTVPNGFKTVLPSDGTFRIVYLAENRHRVLTMLRGVRQDGIVRWPEPTKNIG